MSYRIALANERARAAKAEAERDAARGEIATILAERDAAVSMGTQLERERDEERRLKEEALHCISSAVLALLKARQG
jgi:hypothetical protein